MIAPPDRHRIHPMASATRQRVAWIVVTLLVIGVIWLYATGRQGPQDLAKVVDWLVPLLVGYWLGGRSERRRHRDQQRERRGRLAGKKETHGVPAP
jgi:hypothetical protein